MSGQCNYLQVLYSIPGKAVDLLYSTATRVVHDHVYTVVQGGYNTINIHSSSTTGTRYRSPGTTVRTGRHYQGQYVERTVEH